MSGGVETEEDSPSNGERIGNSSDQKASSPEHCTVVFRRGASGCPDTSPLATGDIEGEIPVSYLWQCRVRPTFSESCSLRWERKVGGTFHPKLNIDSRPIANKYREGKVQSTLERELNVLETVVMQAYGTCAWSEDWVCPGEGGSRVQLRQCSVFCLESEDGPLILRRLPTRVSEHQIALVALTFGSNHG